jgi:hypothetical protein
MPVMYLIKQLTILLVRYNIASAFVISRRFPMFAYVPANKKRSARELLKVEIVKRVLVGNQQAKGER